MKIGDRDVPDILLVEYTQMINNQCFITILSPPALVQASEKRRQELHDAILKAVGEKRGSDFENALFEYREKIYRKTLGINEKRNNNAGDRR